MKLRSAQILARLLAAQGLLLIAQASSARAEECRTALVLALDVSSSVDAAEDRLQREGLAQALVAPEVMQTFLMGAPVALYVFEWSDQHSQAAILPGWQMVRSEEDLARIASIIAGSERTVGHDHRYSRTALGAALAHAGAALAMAPTCRTAIVDVSGDGENNDGVEPAAVYATQSFETITVNALIVGRRGQDDAQQAGWAQYRSYARLVGYYQRQVLHGARAFWVFADGYEDYERAMRVKLQRELELPLIGGMPTTPTAG